MTDETPMGATHTTIVDPSGRPARLRDRLCPRCGALPETRIPSTGFGGPRHPICGRCGHEWPDEVWHD